MTCEEFPSDALRQVYGGQLCQSYHGDLPFTGINALDLFVIGLVLFMIGIPFFVRNRLDSPKDI